MSSSEQRRELGDVEVNRPRLRAAGLRVTRPRLAVLRVLDRARAGQGHLTVATVAAQARIELGSLSAQAVYDCLAALHGVGLVRRVEFAGHPTRYETRVGDHHHHLVCRGCGHIRDLARATGHPACLTPPTAVGFVVDEVEVTFWGRCSRCAPAASKLARNPARPVLPPY
ncbi:Fur family transcriptional regulator [Pseudonocardia halophobica]|uniref:Fur family transcriptional regulator n=1 Tax=Pseudonocardia halophobica TaxID=29401 RepID=UPI003D9405C0